MKKLRNSKLVTLLILLLLIASLVGCGAENGGYMDESYGNASGSGSAGDNIFEGEYPDKEDSSTDGSDATSGDYVERKIVYTVTTQLQTKDFDAAMSLLQTEINDNGGYIQRQKQTDDGGIYSKYSRRSLTMVVRVPSKNLEAFLSGLKNDNMHTLSLSKDSQDLTTAYYDKEIRINSLKIQEERLLDMLSKAEDLKTLLELEDRLTTIRYEIESLTKELNLIDANVAYSTVTIYMDEVVEYKETVEEPAGFGERIWEAFSGSWKDFYDGVQNFVVWLIYAIPTLLVLAAIAAAIVIFIVKTKKRAQKKRTNKPYEQNPYQTPNTPSQTDKK